MRFGKKVGVKITIGHLGSFGESKLGKTGLKELKGENNKFVSLFMNI